MAATNPVDALQEIRRHEAVTRIEQRGRGLFDPDSEAGAKNGTSGYKACVYLDSEGIPTRVFQVGKPKNGGDVTTKGGGPYTVNLDNRECSCPSKQGIKVTNAKGETVVVKEGEVSCKHLIGLFYQLAVWEYELVAIKGATDRKLIKWIKRKDKRDE